MKKLTLALALLAAFSFGAAAQDFTPEPYIQVQGGVAYDFGNAHFGQLLSPAAQIAVGYRFVDCWSARFAVNGWQAKYTSEKDNLYAYKYVQPNLDLVLDWGAGLFGYRPDRPVTLYTLLGVGAAVGVQNKQANALASGGETFQYLWDPAKFFWNTRAGLGTDIRLSDRIALNLELDAQFYPESFNSRKNPHVAAGPDLHLALLGGLTFNLGWRPRKVKPVAAPAPAYQRPEPAPERPQRQVTHEPAKNVQPDEQPIYQGADVDIFFDLNKSVIRDDQVNTLNRLVSFMRNNPDVKVKLDGYADKQTGNADINQELSEQRVISVRQFLVSRGIDPTRISTAAHGDKVQPFSGDKNRVVTCRIR